MKVAIVGVGKMGRRHIEVARSLNLEIVGICDAQSEALLLAINSHNIPESCAFCDAKTMLREAGPECVVIATTAPTHCEFTCLAANTGAKYILCEKPMACSLAECDQMIETCRDRDVRLVVNHQMRYMAQYTEPKRLIDSEAFGGLGSVSVLGGNFGVAMNGCHYFEMFRFLTDESPLEVTAWFSAEKVPNPRGAQFQDRAGAVRLVTASGKRFYLEAGSDQGHGMTVIYSARNGQIMVNELTGEFHSWVREAPHRKLPTTRYGMPAVHEYHSITPADAFAPTKSVIEAMLSGTTVGPSGKEGRLAVEVLVAAHVSDEEGHRTINLRQDILPRERKFPWA
jgi:predicted dehydrogenase